MDSLSLHRLMQCFADWQSNPIIDNVSKLIAEIIRNSHEKHRVLFTTVWHQNVSSVRFQINQLPSSPSSEPHSRLEACAGRQFGPHSRLALKPQFPTRPHPCSLFPHPPRVTKCLPSSTPRMLLQNPHHCHIIAYYSRTYTPLY